MPDTHPPGVSLPQDVERLLLSSAAGLPDVDALRDRLNNLVEENAQLADEVLQSYEHLNLIFELAVQLAAMTDGDELERALYQRIGGLLHCDALCVVNGDESIRWHGGDPRAAADAPPAEGVDLSAISPQSLVEQASRVRSSRRVGVMRLGTVEAISGPLVRLDNRIDAVFAFRRSDSASFKSSDMLMLESALSFGSRMVCNAESHARLRRMSIEVIRALVAAIDKKDHYTRGHSERVAILARLIGEALGLAGDAQETLHWAGLLHDIGKIGVPEAILQKPGRLTDAEFDVIKQHPRMGYEILKPIASFDRVLEAVLYHHEQPDGGGYPDGLRGSDVPLFARIVHVADTFDALTSTRSYRPAHTVTRAMEIIRGDAGVKLDAAVAEVLPRVVAALPLRHGAAFSHVLTAGEAAS